MVEITTGFLGYKLHHSTQTLTYRGDTVSLRPKTLATLQFLLANRHRAVTKDEVLSAIWSDVEVQDQAVFQSISEIRSLLKGHECIETIRGRGYRWTLISRRQRICVIDGSLRLLRDLSRWSE